MGSGADKQHLNKNTFEDRPREEAAGIKTGDARLNEIPGNEKIHIKQAPKCPGKPPLDNTGIRGLMAAIETQGNVLAVQAEIDGMNVSNNEAFASGHTTPPYSEVYFKEKAAQIRHYVSGLHVVRNSLMK